MRHTRDDDLRQRRHTEHAQSGPEQPQQPPHRRQRSGKQYASVPHARALLVGVVAFYALGLSLVGHLYTWLPPPRALDAPAALFSEARARVVLERLLSFGYHPVGTRANEEFIPAYLISEVRHCGHERLRWCVCVK